MTIMDVKTRETINDSTSDEYYHEKCALERVVKDMEAERIISRYSLITVEYLRPGVCEVMVESVSVAEMLGI